jgi:prephenate dehydrogenase
MGSVVVQMTAEEHDRALAVTSHLPHMAAAALANTVPENYFRLAGSGLLDSARLASGDPELWRQILLQNRENVLKALEQFGGQLQALHSAIRTGDEAALDKFLTRAKKNRDALGN